MEYAFRLSALKKPVTLRIDERTLEVLDESRNLTRKIELGEIFKIQQYDGIGTRDSDQGPYRSEMCKLVTKRGRPVYLRNGSYVRPTGKTGEMAINQTKEYVAFLTELKHRLAKANPQAQVVTGWLLASLVWWVNALVGVGLMVLGIAVLLTEDFTDGLLVFLFFSFMGWLLARGGLALGLSYWPKRESVAENLKAMAQEAGNKSSSSYPQ